MTKTTMDDDEANELRLYANEIMYRLYQAKQAGQIAMLVRYGQQALEDLSTKSPKSP